MAKEQEVNLQEMLVAVLQQLAQQGKAIHRLLESHQKSQTPTGRSLVDRVAAIKKAAANRPEPPVHVEPGYAVIRQKGGQARKLVDACMIMAHNCMVELPDGHVVQCGARWDEALAGRFVIEQYAPYPKSAVKFGKAEYFNPEAEEYRQVDGVFYHPVYGEKAKETWLKERKGVERAA